MVVKGWLVVALLHLYLYSVATYCTRDATYVQLWCKFGTTRGKLLYWYWDQVVGMFSMFCLWLLSLSPLSLRLALNLQQTCFASCPYLYRYCTNVSVQSHTQMYVTFSSMILLATGGNQAVAISCSALVGQCDWGLRSKDIWCESYQKWFTKALFSHHLPLAIYGAMER